MLRGFTVKEIAYLAPAEDTDDENLLGCLDYTINATASPNCGPGEVATGAKEIVDLTIS